MNLRHFAVGVIFCAVACGAPTKVTEQPKPEGPVIEVEESKFPETQQSNPKPLQEQPQEIKCPVRLSDGLDAAEKKILEQANDILDMKGYNLFMSPEEIRRQARNEKSELEKVRFRTTEDLYDYKIKKRDHTLRFDFIETTWLDTSSTVAQWKDVPMWKSGKEPLFLKRIGIAYDPYEDWGDKVETGLRERYGKPSLESRNTAVTLVRWGDAGRSYISYIKVRTPTKDTSYDVSVTFVSAVNDACEKELIHEFTAPYREQHGKDKEKATTF